MNVIQRLNVERSRIRYFLSKADTVPNERDRQKVVVQITQNLSSKIRNAHAFELPSLYIPDMMPSGTKSSIENVLEHTCVEMEQTINQNVQNTLNKMEGDCKTITAKIDSLMAKDNEGRGACLPRPRRSTTTTTTTSASPPSAASASPPPPPSTAASADSRQLHRDDARLRAALARPRARRRRPRPAAPPL